MRPLRDSRLPCGKTTYWAATLKKPAIATASSLALMVECDSVKTKFEINLQ